MPGTEKKEREQKTKVNVKTRKKLPTGTQSLRLRPFVFRDHGIPSHIHLQNLLLQKLRLT